MKPLPRIISKEEFTFEVQETKCGSLAYTFYCNDEIVHKNNNYYPTRKAVEDDNLMFNELGKIIVKENDMPIVSASEKKFLESPFFIKLKKMINV
jgi:hypothetical protein